MVVYTRFFSLAIAAPHVCFEVKTISRRTYTCLLQEKAMDKENKKARCTNKQIHALVDYMSTNVLFANGEFSGPMGKTRKCHEWDKLACILNDMGPTKTVGAWQRTWRELKKKARGENAQFKKNSNLTGNITPIIPVSDLSHKVLEIIGPASSIGFGPAESGVGDTTTIEEVDLSIPEWQADWCRPVFGARSQSPYEPTSPTQGNNSTSSSNTPHNPTFAISQGLGIGTTGSHTPVASSSATATETSSQRSKRPKLTNVSNAEHFRRLHIIQNQHLKDLVFEMKKNNEIKHELHEERKIQSALLTEILDQLKTGNKMKGSSTATLAIEGVEAIASKTPVSDGTGWESNEDHTQGLPTAASSPLREESIQFSQALVSDGAGRELKEDHAQDLPTTTASPLLEECIKSSQAPHLPSPLKPVILNTKQIKRGKLEVVKLKDGRIILKQKKENDTS